MDPPTSVSHTIANISGTKYVGESSHNNHGVEDDDVSNSILPYSSTIPSWGDDDDYFQNTFGVYSSFLTQPTIHDELNCTEIAAAEEVEGLERKQNEQKVKQKRSGKMHTISERRRRERIRGKIKALQELIPNCNKWNKASILDDAINYIKSLKLQVEMMAMARGGLFQVPYMPPTGIQTPPFSPLGYMRPAAGTMGGMCFSTGQAPPIPAALGMQSPLSVAAAAGLPLMTGTGTGNIGLSHLQLPFYHSQLPVPPAAAATSTMVPNFLALGGISPAIFNYPSQGESGSQNIPPTSSIDCRLQMPITSQLPLEDQVSGNVLASTSPSKFHSS